MSLSGQLAAGTCEIVMLDRDSSQPRRTIARQTARCACKKGQIAGTTRAMPACVDGKSFLHSWEQVWIDLLQCVVKYVGKQVVCRPELDILATDIGLYYHRYWRYIADWNIQTNQYIFQAYSKGCDYVVFIRKTAGRAQWCHVSESFLIPYALHYLMLCHGYVSEISLMFLWFPSYLWRSFLSAVTVCCECSTFFLFPQANSIAISLIPLTCVCVCMCV